MFKKLFGKEIGTVFKNMEKVLQNLFYFLLEKFFIYFNFMIIMMYWLNKQILIEVSDAGDISLFCHACHFDSDIWIAISMYRQHTFSYTQKGHSSFTHTATLVRDTLVFRPSQPKLKLNIHKEFAYFLPFLTTRFYLDVTKKTINISRVQICPSFSLNTVWRYRFNAKLRL